MNEKATVLIVDDTKDNIKILSSLLDDYDIVVALNGNKALEMVEKNKVDIILLDIMMPEMDGYSVCKTLKSQKHTKHIPILFITAKTDEESIEKAYDVGGVDYVTKPFKPKELLARLNKELQVQKLISDLKQTQKELKLLASTDSMTGLYNRRHFYEISETILHLSKRNKTKASLIMLDIDKFKNINDTYGHQVGDNVIILLSSKLKELTRDSDIVCRFGGEEFVILLPETSIEGALNLSEKVREDAENTIMTLDSGDKLQFTVSIGISEASDLNVETAIHKADEALYEAKKTGRNKTCYRV